MKSQNRHNTIARINPAAAAAAATATASRATATYQVSRKVPKLSRHRSQRQVHTYNTGLNSQSATMIQVIRPRSASVDTSATPTASDYPVAAQQKKKQTKRVTFKDKARQRKHIHINNYTDGEYESAWYTDEEYKMIKSSASTTIQLMSLAGGKFQETEELSSRGLEKYLSSKEIVRTRNRITRAIIQEQNRQWAYNYADDEEIASIYAQLSKKSAMRARELGMMDEHFAKAHNRFGRGTRRGVQRSHTTQSLPSTNRGVRQLMRRQSSRALTGSKSKQSFK